MGNQQTQPQFLTQKYILIQEASGLEKPSEENSCRLFKSLRFYSPKDKFFVLDKLFFFDHSDAFEDSQTMQKTVSKNYSYYRKRLTGLEGNTVLFPRLSETDFSIRRQYMKTTLEDALNPSEFLPEDDKFWLLFQSFNILQGLHNRDLPHCNIKPSNLLISSTNRVILTDFSIFKPHFLLNQDLDKISLCYPTLDERCYLSPERFLDSGKTEIVDFQGISCTMLNTLKKSDIFSLGRAD